MLLQHFLDRLGMYFRVIASLGGCGLLSVGMRFLFWNSWRLRPKCNPLLGAFVETAFDLGQWEKFTLGFGSFVVPRSRRSRLDLLE